MKITLQRFSVTDFDALNAYQLSDAQARFTARIDDWVNDRKDLDDSDTIIVVIKTQQHDAVGFFVLDKGNDKYALTDNHHAILIRSFSVNPAYQGMGIGRQAMHLAPDFIRGVFSEVNEIVLSVNCKNTTAYHVYLSAGYIDNGALVDGPMGMQHVLSKTIRHV